MLYIGHFIHATNQEQVEEADRRHGEFNMAAQAPDAASALELFRLQILYYRKRHDFFEGVCRIYLVELFEFDRFPDHQAVMLNYKSVAGDPVMPFIRCAVPTSDTDACRIFDWDNHQPRVDGQNEKLFLAFNGAAPDPDV